ncbi:MULTISPECIES: hypothetical protein [unclassified Mesorhizobium]|uniref:hypothetical protein n=1 Tax=unclassified Mesorhizobium TaxID=325217 RepID=UPI000F761077|nr:MULTISPECIES: hypothetical protein [unclassified Mesorhizobium]AZO54871.1 hypothetical protein EJ077_16495 [Mesorhizobium sp. M8A.F.Ca.ET.057.01.1.1]RWE44147.1 MAG: hypothetical protein EOS80_19570 [Mesorhizobium sp.]
MAVNMSDNYNPCDWYWIVGNDESRAWSSVAGTYVDALPEDAGITHIVSEDELTDVLAVYGLPGPSLRVPDRVSPAQAEIALFNVDNGLLLGIVNAAIEAFPYEPVRIWWRKATYISRDHAYLQALAIEVGLTDEQVEDLFVAAAKL